MTSDTGSRCDQSSEGNGIVMIPAPDQYEIDCCGNAVKQVVGGSWVRYDDHVASIKLMRSHVEKLEEQIAGLNDKLRDAKLEAKDFQSMLRGLNQ
jgi:hypothetical protein